MGIGDNETRAPEDATTVTDSVNVKLWNSSFWVAVSLVVGAFLHCALTDQNWLKAIWAILIGICAIAITTIEHMSALRKD